MTSFVCTMAREARVELAHALMEAGVGGEDLGAAMDGRLCDLADTVEIARWRIRG